MNTIRGARSATFVTQSVPVDFVRMNAGLVVVQFPTSITTEILRGILLLLLKMQLKPHFLPVGHPIVILHFSDDRSVDGFEKMSIQYFHVRRS